MEGKLINNCFNYLLIIKVFYQATKMLLFIYECGFAFCLDGWIKQRFADMTFGYVNIRWGFAKPANTPDNHAHNSEQVSLKCTCIIHINTVIMS